MPLKNYLSRKKFLIQFIPWALFGVLLSACGGGGSAQSGSEPLRPNSSIVASSSSAAQSSISNGNLLTKITRQNTPALASTYLDLIVFAKQTSASMVNGEFSSGLADGEYKGSCEGSNGSYEITVANGGDTVKQKYINCLIINTADGDSLHLIVSGEENYTITRYEDTPYIFHVTWKDYSITVNNTSQQTMNGNFNYEGFLYYDRNVQYIDVTSHIKMNVLVNVNGASIQADNVDFVFDFPAIFDKYSNGFESFGSKPQGIHVFSKKIVSASGRINSANSTADFNLNSENIRTTFTGSDESVAYIDTDTNGLYFRWDQEGDGLADANVFLTETEYTNLSEHVNEQGNNIYFVHFPSLYGTSLPSVLWVDGIYDTIDLSRGASIEVSVQQLFTNISGNLLTYEIDNQSYSNDWTQTAAGVFLLKFPDSKGTEEYKLNFTAIDVFGNKSPAIKATVRMNNNLTDTDGDGVLDIHDDDIDNDGILNRDSNGNIIDQFPYDATESKDFDFDGIGDNADSDRDNDGIENSSDTYPFDKNCSTLELGDGERCFLTRTRYGFIDTNGVLYLMQDIRGELNEEKMRFVRFDTNTAKFLNASSVIDIPANYLVIKAFNVAANSVFAYDYLHHKMYNLNLEDFTLTFIRDTTDQIVRPILSENGYLAVSVSTNRLDYSWIEIYDTAGNLKDSNKEQVLAATNHYYPTDVQTSVAVPFCDHSFSIGSDGKLIESGDWSLISDNNCNGVNSVSQDGLYSFSGADYPIKRPIYDVSRKIFTEVNGNQLQWQDNLLVYVDNQTYNLTISDLNGQILHSVESEESGAGTVAVTDQKIISFLEGDYYHPTYIKIFDKNLELLFDSRTH